MLIYLSLIDSEYDKLKFEEIYIQYKQIMFYTANNILKDEHLAEDVVHNSFIKIIKNLSKINQVNCPKTKAFIVIIVERTAIDVYRKRKKQNTVSIEDDFYNTEISKSLVENNNENYDEIDIAIANLPPNYRQVILLKFSHDYSDAEISKLLNISQDNVRKRIQRGKKKLKEILIELEVQSVE
ncbi:TPA: RNA polymerase sigma factor [Clostridioides difficile]|nr:RNA polymerase sigma factor [Clostridioides difficile]HDJ1471001.1 RNA polymerase sigma factor [Clostridioides difficile]